ncbi:potassium-transporting ATPase subunit KdpC [Tatumella sp. TA1]|nr:potassium-transporting ATPase subunit KdpC [Tatumella sp. TA1]
MNIFRPAVSLFLLLTLLTGIVYPLLTTVVGNRLFPQQAQGSLIKQGSVLLGSTLIGQDFTQAGYFHGRPSATAGHADNPLASGGSNLAVSNPQLAQRIDQQVSLLRSQNPLASRAVPTELVTTSASGLDPTLSLAAVEWQIPRVAQARHLAVSDVKKLVSAYTEQPRLSFMGPTVVNLVALNIALDQRLVGK